MIENMIKKGVIPGRRNKNKLKKKIIKRRMIRKTSGEDQPQDEETTVQTLILTLQNAQKSIDQQRKGKNLQKGRSLQFVEDQDQEIAAEVETIVKT